MDAKNLLNAMIANFVETAPKAVGLYYLHPHYIEREARFGVILHATLIIYPDWDISYASEWLIEQIDAASEGAENPKATEEIVISTSELQTGDLVKVYSAWVQITGEPVVHTSPRGKVWTWMGCPIIEGNHPLGWETCTWDVQGNAGVEWTVLRTA